jgi:hypothetical protein
MVHPIVSTPRLEAAMERIRPFAFALPGVVERPSHGSPTCLTAETCWTGEQREHR